MEQYLLMKTLEFIMNSGNVNNLTLPWLVGILGLSVYSSIVQSDFSHGMIRTLHIYNK